MKRQLMGAALGLAMVFGGMAGAQPAAAQGPTVQDAERVVALSGCVAVAEDGTMVVTVAGGGRGPQAGARGGQETFHVQIPEGSEVEGTVQNGCGTVVVYQVDGVWYAKSVQVTGDGSGNVEYQATEVSGDGEGNATVEQESGSGTRPVGPLRNR